MEEKKKKTGRRNVYIVQLSFRIFFFPPPRCLLSIYSLCFLSFFFSFSFWTGSKRSLAIEMPVVCAGRGSESCEEKGNNKKKKKSAPFPYYVRTTRPTPYTHKIMILLLLLILLYKRSRVYIIR